MTKPHPFSPRDIIHSVPTPSSSSSSSRSKSRLLQVFSPRHHSAKSTTLRRLFAFSPRPRPTASRNSDDPSTPTSHQTSVQRDSDESTLSPATSSLRLRRRKPLWTAACACFSPSARPLRSTAQEFDMNQHLRTLEPTYEPESPLLPGPAPHDEDRICLVLDLDETLVHSSFSRIDGADFEIPLEMQGETHTVFVKKRPGVDDFLQKVSQWYEIVIFTASLALYANPVMDLLDPEKRVQLRLYREHCVLIDGFYVKDIARLGRDLRRTVIIDNSPLSYVFQPENAIPISAFFTDDNDRELEKTLALLEQAKHLKDVRKALS